MVSFHSRPSCGVGPGPPSRRLFKRSGVEFLHIFRGDTQCAFRQCPIPLHIRAFPRSRVFRPQRLPPQNRLGRHLCRWPTSAPSAASAAQHLRRRRENRIPRSLRGSPCRLVGVAAVRHHAARWHLSIPHLPPLPPRRASGLRVSRNEGRVRLRHTPSNLGRASGPAAPRRLMVVGPLPSFRPASDRYASCRGPHGFPSGTNQGA